MAVMDVGMPVVTWSKIMKALRKYIGRKYYTVQIKDFTQPAITSNGTMGGDTWAVSCTTNGGDVRGSAWNSVYPQQGTYYCYSKGGRPATWFYFYTPYPTIVTGYYCDTGWNGGYRYFYGSNIYGDWKLIKDSGFIGSGSHTITFSNTTPYQYYQMIIQSPGGRGGDGVEVGRIRLITEQIVIDGTEQEHDYYKDVYVYNVYKKHGFLYTLEN